MYFNYRYNPYFKINSSHQNLPEASDSDSDADWLTFPQVIEMQANRMPVENITIINGGRDPVDVNLEYTNHLMDNVSGWSARLFVGEEVTLRSGYQTGEPTRVVFTPILPSSIVPTPTNYLLENVGPLSLIRNDGLLTVLTT